MVFIAKRVRFRNGERHSVLVGRDGLPVHEVVLFLDRFRRRGRAANTIHAVCCCLSVLYRELATADINLVERLQAGRFLTASELSRVASAVQYRADDLEGPSVDSTNVINIARIRMRQTHSPAKVVPVDIATQATRLRYIGRYLEFLADYVGATLPAEARTALRDESARAMKAFFEQVPPVTKRAKLNARVGLSVEEQERVTRVVHPDSSDNPWVRGYVRTRNWLIVVLLLATGMRRGELLGMQIGDLNGQEPKLKILRRADAPSDSRRTQPNTKTHDREVQVSLPIMRLLWQYINDDRRKIKAALAVPQIFVSHEGAPLSVASIDKMFDQLHRACPGLPGKVTSHVMRHTWNERFSEQAELLGLSATEEERARNAQQGWSDNSKSAAVYTRRRTAKQACEISLKLQKVLDAKLKSND